MVPFDFVPEPGCPESSYKDRDLPAGTVHDLVECLGNQTRYKILQQGPEIFVESTPFDYDTRIEDTDDIIWDCVRSANLHGGITSQIVPLDRLRATSTVLVPLDFVPKSPCEDLQCNGADNVSRATVRDLVECLGTQSRHTIHPDGTGILLQESPYGWMPDEFQYLDHTDCIHDLRMDGVRHEIVGLEMLRQEDASQGDRYVSVPLDFVPKSSTWLAWYDYSPHTDRGLGAQSKDEDVADAAPEGQLPLSPTVAA